MEQILRNHFKKTKTNFAAFKIHNLNPVNTSVWELHGELQGVPIKPHDYKFLKKKNIFKKITEPKISFIIFWEVFYLYKNVSTKISYIFPKYCIAYFGLCNFFYNGCLIFQNFLSCGFIGTPCIICNFPFPFSNTFLTVNWAIYGQGVMNPDCYRPEI